MKLRKCIHIFIACAIALPLQSRAAVAVAAADNSKSGSYDIFEIWDAKSVGQAEAKVLSDCRDDAKAKGLPENCRVVFSALGPGYLAVVRGANGKNVGAALEQGEAEAIAHAYADCSKNSSPCNRTTAVVRQDTLGEKREVAPRPEMTPAAAAALGAQYPLPSSNSRSTKSAPRRKSE